MQLGFSFSPHNCFYRILLGSTSVSEKDTIALDGFVESDVHVRSKHQDHDPTSPLLGSPFHSQSPIPLSVTPENPKRKQLSRRKNVKVTAAEDTNTVMFDVDEGGAARAKMLLSILTKRLL